MHFRVFSEEFPRLGENAWWSSCFSVLGKTVERIAKTLTVTATCDVDTATGLPEFPVQGRIKFTQPVTSSLVVLRELVVAKK